MIVDSARNGDTSKPRPEGKKPPFAGTAALQIGEANFGAPMRQATSFTLIFLASLATGVSFLACGSDEKNEPSSSPGRGGAGGFDINSILRPDSGLPDGGGQGGQGGALADAGDGGDDPKEAGPPSCESCGSVESAKNCGGALTACRADAGCKRIYDCIYTYRGCGLTSSDLDCIQGCFDDYCDDAKSVALYLAYDQCTYCSDACEDACSAYCPAFPKGGTVMTRCSDGAPDGGGGDAPDGGTGGAGGAGGEGGEGGEGGSGGSDDPGEPDDPPDEPDQVCVPGKQEACACIGGAQGAQICNANGTGFGPCGCPRPDTGTGGSGGSAGSGGDDSGGGSGDDDHGDDDDDD